MHFEGRSFTGVSNKNQPGIDGVLTNEGSLLPNPQPISLKETQGSLVAVLSAASTAEEQAKNAGLSQVDLYINATNPNINTATMVDFIKQGASMGQGGLMAIPTQGTLKSITIFTVDGVVRAQAGRVFSCTKDGNCQ